MNHIQTDSATLMVQQGRWILSFSCLVALHLSCGSDQALNFTEVPVSHSGISFSNQLQPTEETNCYTYKSFYNGGGVGLADLDGDGLLDVVLSGNQVSSEIYLNKRDFRFEAVTDHCGIDVDDIWHTGITLGDIDGDGDIDMYLATAGPPGASDLAQDELYLNNGKAYFERAAHRVGLKTQAPSTQAVFFDYDNDGDLDIYLLSNSIRSVGAYDLQPGLRNIPDSLGGNKLYQNQLSQTSHLSFIEVTSEAGIFSSSIGFGLGALPLDANNDGLTDLYVSNDFFERDYLYINAGDGTFKESLPSYMSATSLGSMGAESADLTGNGKLDIFVTDMLPEDPQRYKKATRFDSYKQYLQRKNAGYHRQFTRNTLQVQGENSAYFERSRQLGLHASDWSWGALAFDGNMDGRHELFVANGIRKDITDQDYINFKANSQTIKRAIRQGSKTVIMDLLDQMPSVPIANAYFEYDSNSDRFIDNSALVGLSGPGYSNGAAYGDLDNDGDIDLIVNNVDHNVSLYQNTTNSPGKQRIDFVGLNIRTGDNNTAGFGALVYTYSDSEVQIFEINPIRGFQSSSDTRLSIPIRNNTELDSVIVLYNRKVYKFETFSYNQYNDIYLDGGGDTLLQLNQEYDTQKHDKVLTTNFLHQENSYSDFDFEPFRIHGGSTRGPAVATSSVAKGGCYTFYGSGRGSLSLVTYDFDSKSQAWELPISLGDHVDAKFVDLIEDSQPELFIAVGGSEIDKARSNFSDLLYTKVDTGWIDVSYLLPVSTTPSSAVESIDLNRDGSLDLLVGKSWQAGFGSSGGLEVYINEGGRFRLALPHVTQKLQNLGSVTDIAIFQRTPNGNEVILAGEWMPIYHINFLTSGKVIIDTIPGSAGWHQCIGVVNRIGTSPDIVVGNLGENQFLKRNTEEILRLYSWLENFRIQALVSRTNKRDIWEEPLALYPDVMKSIPAVRKVFSGFSKYAIADTKSLLSAGSITPASVRKIETVQSGVYRLRQGQWIFRAFPQLAQAFPIYASSSTYNDLDTFLYLGGGLEMVNPAFGNYPAQGILRLRLSDDEWTITPEQPWSTSLEGEVRAITQDQCFSNQLIIGMNQDSARKINLTQ